MADGLLPLHVSGLVYAIGGSRLIDGIDLAIEAGALTVVMGANGAGKSVLLRLLHGLLTPTAGTIYWAGQAPGEAVRNRQAMVFQRPVLLRRSVAANLDFVLRLRGRVDPERRQALLERVGLSTRVWHSARLLSGGEQQRLALARALAVEPEVLFLDEPTASLDPASVLTIETLVREVQAAGTKVIFVTHDVAQARRLAGDVVFLHHGQLIEHAEATRFFEQPSSAVAAAYLEGRIVV